MVKSRSKSSGRASRRVRRPLFIPDLAKPTAQQGDDFLLNLRIVQKAQKRLFDSLVLLGLLDLVLSFGLIRHAYDIA